jgi:hypothetical protein
MLIEMRQYLLETGSIPAFYKIYQELGLPVQAPILGNLLMAMHTEIGPLNSFIHLWGYESYADRDKRRAELAAHPEWPKYLKEALPLLKQMQNKVCIAAPFSQIKNTAPEGITAGIIEVRSYTVNAGGIPKMMDAYENLGLPMLREAQGDPLAVMHSDVGPLNNFVHIWGYENADQRMEQRAISAKHPERGKYSAEVGPLMRGMENMICVPAPFSPVRPG